MASLRFVEVNGDNENIEILENLPFQMVGHQGGVKPKISNGHISRFHASVCHNFEYGIDKWVIFDGNKDTGELSRNGLVDKYGSKITGKITLENIGDKVYLLYMYDTIAYLEVFITNVEKVRITGGLEDEAFLDHKINKLAVNNSLIKTQLVTTMTAIHKGEVTKDEIINKLDTTSVDVETNKSNIESLGRSNEALNAKVNMMSALLEQGLNHVEEVGTKPKIFITGFLIMIIATVMSLLSYGVYQNLDPIMKSIFRLENQVK